MFILIVAVVAIAALVLSHKRMRTTSPVSPARLSTGLASTAPVAQVVSPLQPQLKADAERVAWIEKLGRVPPGATLRDRWLAGRTSWWGKRLDPKEFWKGRVLWCDQSATDVANSVGRGYPPIPYDDPGTRQFPDADHRPVPSAEGYSIPYLSSSREGIFWDHFNRTHPLPPEKIARYQTSGVKYHKEDAIFRGCPQEALSDEAMCWARVMKFRNDYQTALALPPDQMAEVTNYVLGEAGVEAKLITEPLTNEQLKAANAWKIAYLQRLRREKTDESYINAYLKAWNLTRAEVFGQ